MFLCGVQEEIDLLLVGIYLALGLISFRRMIRVPSDNSYPDDLRSKPEVIDPPQIDELLEVCKDMNDSAQSTFKPIVSTSVRELLECPVCLNSMYPPHSPVSEWAYALFWLQA
ncbi:hypothetical protein QQ045_015931 [Rhodiola kirilowii]